MIQITNSVICLITVSFKTKMAECFNFMAKNAILEPFHFPVIFFLLR